MQNARVNNCQLADGNEEYGALDLAASNNARSLKQITTNYIAAPKVRSQLDLLNIRKRSLLAENDASVAQSFQKY